MKFKVSPTNFKHTGLFPEQATNWDFMMDAIKNSNRKIKVLNLFSYTGAATMACSSAGADVVQSASTVNGIYYLVNMVPVVTCILELVGIGMIFNLDQKTTDTMYKEMAKWRAN